MNKIEDDKFFFSQSDIARIFDKSQPAIFKMIEKKGLFHHEKIGRGKEKLYCLPEFYKKCILEKEKKKSELKLDEERAKLARAQRLKTDVERKLKNIEIAEKEKKLVDATGIQKELDKIFLSFRSKLLSMSNRLAVILSMKEKFEIEKILGAAIEEALKELANGKFE